MAHSAHDGFEFIGLAEPRSADKFVASSRAAHKTYQRTFHAAWMEWTALRHEEIEDGDDVSTWARFIRKLEKREEFKFLTWLTKNLKAARLRLGAA